jgi:hypothetical protein
MQVVTAERWRCAIDAFLIDVDSHHLSHTEDCKWWNSSLDFVKSLLHDGVANFDKIYLFRSWREYLSSDDFLQYLSSDVNNEWWNSVEQRYHYVQFGVLVVINDAGSSMWEQNAIFAPGSVTIGLAVHMLTHKYLLQIL